MNSMESKNSIALYPGSFDPFTNGHVDIVQRSLKIFDKTIVVVAGNLRKKESYFSVEERKDLISQVFKNEERVEVDSCDDLIMNYAREKNAKVMIRGLRAVGDFENEFIMASMNQGLNKEVETFFMVTSRDWYFLSSSVLKEVISYGGDISSYVPEPVMKAINLKGK